MANSKIIPAIEILPIDNISFLNLSPGSMIAVTIRTPYHNKFDLCITNFISKNKKSNFVCTINGVIANHKEYGGNIATIKIHRNGTLKLEIQV